MLDDLKWKHTSAQFELNRKFALEHNPTDDSMTTGPDIHDNYNHQVNAYGETRVYKCDCGQLAPKLWLRPRPTGATELLAGPSSPKSKSLSMKWLWTLLRVPLVDVVLSPS